jgi:phosphopantothenoylcysteine decarboxylase / phosphopantothenate---cysteine ligase
LQFVVIMKSSIDGKKIVLGVSGGIAAYKSVELLRLLKQCGADVRVILTKNAEQFVGPITFEALSGHPVCSDLFEKGSDATMRHISWAEAADCVVIAPATANIIGKISAGIADDALTTFLLAVTAPVLLCPAMNTNMYENRIVQRNVDQLEAYGYTLVEPGIGTLACGTTGPGRLAEPMEIVDRVMARLTSSDLKGKRILVTAGPTHESIDPVRFVTNPSSGKMGYAVARAAEHRGASVVLVSGPTNLSDPANMEIVHVRTACQMADAVFEHAENVDVVIKTAAVSDYRSRECVGQKIKKDSDKMILEFQRNPDILKALGQRKKRQLLVGFAAETQNLDQYAKKKLEEKNLDMIVGNIVGSAGAGFESDRNQVTIYHRDGTVAILPAMEKFHVAHEILDRVVAEDTKT